MEQSARSLRIALVGLLVPVIVLSGCSTLKGSRRLDMAPFAENTSLMFSDAAQISRPFQAVHLRPYAAVPEIQESRVRSEPIIRSLRALVLYSNQVVALNASGKSDKDKNRLLADYIRDASGTVGGRDLLRTLGVTASGLDSILTNIRGARTFLDGIHEASVLTNAIVALQLSQLDDLSDYFPRLLGALDDAIESNYRQRRAAYEGLTALQSRYLLATTFLYRGKSGEPAAFDSLVRLDPSMRAYVSSPQAATAQTLAAAEAELGERLERISAGIQDLGTERETYLATHRELTELRLNLDQRVKLARDAVIVWGQSHRNLGVGVPVPPLINLSSIASGAVKAVPLP